jgi:hypothetical protein
MSLSEKHYTLTDKQISQIYRNVFSTIDGQLVLEDIRQRCFAYVPEDFEAKTDRDVFINIGKRSVLLTIETQMKPYKENE